MSAPATIERCPGCGLSGTGTIGATHPYIGASPYCWERYGELLVLAGGRLVVDTYACQHPGEPERRSIQSVAVHLMSLCGHFERNLTDEQAPELMRQALDSEPHPWRWLDIDQPVGTITVVDVLEDRADLAAWSAAVWDAWAPFHDEVRGWLDDLWPG